MQQPRKRHYRKKIRDSFAYIRAHIWYQKLISLPFGMRVFFAVFLFLIGLIALITPIPAGWVMIGISGVLVFGIRMVRRQSIRVFFALRLHIVWEKIRLFFR